MRPRGRRRGAIGCAGVALVLGMSGAPARAQDSAEVARARQVLEAYQSCELTRRFAPCWPLLSDRVQRDWARQGRGTVAEYALAKGAEESGVSSFRVMQIRRSPSRVVFVVEAIRAADRDRPGSRVEYAVLREGGQWKIDGLRRGQSETTP
jgi:hypothetical protein